jgi:hypothetical protein
MRRPLAFTLALLMPLAAVVQAASPPPLTNEAVLPIDPGLRKKTVLVRLRDGRIFQGKLKEITADTLVLQVKDLDPATGKKVTRLETVDRTQVIWVEKTSSPNKRIWGVALGLAAILVPIVIAFAATDKNKT